MVKAVVDGIRIVGLRVAIPETLSPVVDGPDGIPRDEASKLSKLTGVETRRIAPPDMCVSDICLAAAQGLLAQLDWDPKSIDLLIFVTQDSDYVIPATACVLQNQLGLSTDCAAFDVNLGCSGYTYGLWQAGQLLAGSQGKRALLLTGDISSRKLKPGDKSTIPLFGDAGAATALERDADAPPMYIELGTDGRGAKHLIIEAGGGRTPLLPSETSADEATQAMLFEKSRLHMNGAEVFTFSLKAVPKLLSGTLALAGWEMADVDHVVLHQANKFMLETLSKKIKASPEQMVIDMGPFGNTSSSSIPLAMVHKLAASMATQREKYLLAGFGVGWSWGAVATEIGPINRPEIVEIPDDAPRLMLA